jgi:putative peptidoglycan lipid II flippase
VNASTDRSGTARTILRGAGLIFAITLLSRIVGFLRYLVFGGSVGAGDVGTAYTSANQIPNLLFEIVAGGALAATVVPLVAGLLGSAADEARRERADRIISSLLSWTLVLTVPLAVLTALLAHPIAVLVLGGSDADASEATVALGARMLRVFAVQLPLYGITAVLAANLQARKRFLWPALVPLLSSLVVIIAYRIYATMVPAVATTETVGSGAEAVLAWGTTAGVVVMAVTVLIASVRAGLRIRPVLRMPQGVGRKALSLAAAGLGAVGAQQVAMGLVLILAMRTGGTGTLPVFQYAQAVYLLPYAVLVVPLITSVFPHLSEQRLVGDTPAFARTAATSLRSIAAIASVGGATLFAAGPALEAFFHRIDRAGATGVGPTTAALALGLVGYGVTTQCTRILSSALRARDALIVGSVGWLTGGVLVVLVATSLVTDHPANAATGFGFAFSIGMWVSALVGLARIGDLVSPAGPTGRLWRVTVVGGLVAAAAGIPGVLLGRWLIDQSTGTVLTVLVGVLCGLTGMVLSAGIMMLVDRAAMQGVLRRIRSRRRGRSSTAVHTSPTRTGSSGHGRR